jgi:hypothetical protein
MFQFVFLLNLLSIGWLIPALAGDFQVGDTVVLHATKPVGVPLHREPTPSFWKHVPTGSPATIRKTAKDGRWLSIVLETGEEGWVVQKYIRSATQRPPKPGQVSDQTKDEQAVWSTPALCEQIVQDGKRLASASSSTLRLATWNVRWFPDGEPDDRPDDIAEPTDLTWLVCTIVWMQVDILAIQESLATPEARKAWDKVTTSLHQRTGDQWRWTRQRCGQANHHHIGLLWNASRVSLTHFDSLWQFNAKAGSSKTP